MLSKRYGPLVCICTLQLRYIQEDNRLWFDVLLFLLYCFNFLAYRRSDHVNLIGFNF